MILAIATSKFYELLDAFNL